MTHLLFVDTNIWLDEYRYDPPTAAGDVSAILQAKDILVTTSQLRNEFLRNLDPAIAKGIRDVREGKFPPRVAHLASQAALAEAALDNLRHHYNTDPAWLAVEAVTQPRLHHLAETSADWEGYVERAEKRRQLNKPPGKDKHTSLGDHINWLWCLERCRLERKALIICSRDTDYGKLGNPGHPNQALVQEFTDTVGNGYTLQLTNHVRQALKWVHRTSAAPPPVAPPYKGDVPRLLGKRYPPPT